MANCFNERVWVKGSLTVTCKDLDVLNFTRETKSFEYLRYDLDNVARKIR